MAEVNYGLALGVKAPEPAPGMDLGKTLSTYASLQMSQAHAGLYSLEAAKQAMTIQGLQAYQSRLAGGQKPEDAIDALSFSPELQQQALTAAKSRRDLISDSAFDKSHNPYDIANPITQADVIQKRAATGLDAARTTGENLANTGKRMGLVAQVAQSMPGLVSSLPTSLPQRDPFNQPQQPQQEDPQIVAARATIAGGVANNMATGTVPAAQANAAWSHAIDGMLKNGLITPQQAEQWRNEGYSPARIKQLMDQGLSPHDNMLDSGAARANQLAADRQNETIRNQSGATYTTKLHEDLGTADASALGAANAADIARQVREGGNKTPTEITTDNRAQMFGTPPGQPPGAGAAPVAQPPAGATLAPTSPVAPTAPPQAVPGGNQMMTPAQREAVVLPRIAQAAAALPEGPNRTQLINSLMARAIREGAISDTTFTKFARRDGGDYTDDDIKAIGAAAPASAAAPKPPTGEAPVAPGQPAPWKSAATLEAEKATKLADIEVAKKEKEGQVAVLKDLSDAGIDARGQSAQLASVAALGDKVGYGVIPKLQSMLGRYGVNTDGLSDIQAYERAIDFMSPQLRPIGSGRLMQQELDAFKSALGGLMTTQDGRRISIENLALISKYREQIGRAASDTSLSPQERIDKIYNEIAVPHLRTSASPVTIAPGDKAGYDALAPGQPYHHPDDPEGKFRTKPKAAD